MAKDEEQSRGISAGAGDRPPQYGTFQGVANYPPPPPPPGFPQPVPPPGASHEPSAPLRTTPRVIRPFQVIQLPKEGPFIIGFFLAGIPWYVGLCFVVCCRHRMDYREKPGYIACTIAAILVTIAIIFGVTKGVEDR
ncbi:hypothetical protein NL676_027083 [Syzygium grande]|nr:hypothetical protein NL676_027083 [Syzygium grande]